ncbi:rho GTPase-activating protein 23-like isoform X4 [Sinocyclocheilus anshuiensis]|uniref:rho GTPase-activating protein 23-like isoform X4 n=1 Tax=Sinocyclocheilus anshuiensis TaxID=1608454 RepID=UPI0007BA60F9|nr:PREDICTED: rho GTPase-activating protein 23-like isoform X4 [Sinocyclocheilus anshuiensis]
MWSAGQVPLAMPAVCPRVGGKEWCFQDAVGVDCSSPEPRCIWVAVLHRDAPQINVSNLQNDTIESTNGISAGRALPRPSQTCRAKGRRDGSSSSSENPRPVVRSGADGLGVSWQGPRTLVLHKNSQGFGFTLRHFIVYPPESALHTSLKDEENGNGKGLHQSRLEPMDTIFVKNVREKGPAHQAGLCTGDRLVKVNGESVLGKTYSQVIALIQHSESVLELSIMPKDEDVLQLAYSHDAYLRGNNPYIGKAQNLPPPPPVLYPPHTKSQPPALAGPAPASSYMGQNQLDNWSRWPGSSSGPSPPLDNRTVASNAFWAAEGRSCEPGGVGHSSPAHRTEEIQYGMTDRGPQATGQMRGRSYSSSSSSGGMMSPLHHAHLANHNMGTAVGHIGGRKESPPWASPSQSISTPPSSRSECTQQALSNWYYSQVPGREQERERERSVSRSMHPRHRSFSHDRLGELGRAKRSQQAGFPHSASQDTLLLLQQSSAAYTDPHWNHGDWRGEHVYGQHPSVVAYGRKSSENLLVSQYGHSARSLETLDRAVGILSPRLERSTWVHQPPNRTESYLRHGGHCGQHAESHHQIQQHQVQHHTPQHHQHTPQHQNVTHAAHQHSSQTSQPQQAAPLARRLPSCQSLDEEPIGYRSYSPSFNRKTGRILQQAQSFRDPSYTGPHLWTPTPKTSPPEGLPPSASPSPAPPTTSSTTSIPTAPEGQDRTYRPTNHDRGAGEATGEAQTQEVVLRQKPPTGRRGANALRHPHYGIALDSSDPLLFTSDPTEPPAKVESAISYRRTNGNLPPLSIEDDSLASIPFIDEPTSPSADLRARHVPASSVVSSGGINSAPAVATSPASPTFTFPLNRLFSHDCRDPKSNRRSSYLLAITTERSKSCDEGLNAYREEGRVFSRIPKRVKSFFTEGSLDSLGAAAEARSKRHSTSELGSISYSDVKREGWLHFKQIHTEKGKKVGSAIWPWRRVFSVLRSHSLFLYKDKREAVLKGAVLGGGAEEEQPISIRGCLVDIAYSETKRKHALRLTTQDFCEYLLQAEDREDMLEWIRVIRENGKTDNEELGFSRQALINKKLNDYRKQSPTGNKPDSSPRVPRMTFLLSKQDNSPPPRSPKHEAKDESSPPKSPWGINIMKKAKKASPKVFCVRLEDCQPATNNKFIPLIVEICCGLVEDMGLEYTGIYRVPGNNAVVSSLQEQLNKGGDINIAEEKWQDLNVVSSLLKSFFRKLPEPLFTDDKYNDFIEANRMENASDRLRTMKKLIRDLPDYYFHTLKFLIGHLKTVADHSEKNKMEPRNLALVFGPTLVRNSEDNMTDMVTHMPDRYKIVETLIQHHAWFFSEENEKDEKTPVDTEDVQPAPNIDHLLSNIGRTGPLGEASDSTNSDSAKSKGSWGSKRDFTPKDILTFSIMSAVTRKRRKRQNGRLLGSSTDDDSEHEPLKSCISEKDDLQEMGQVASFCAPRAEGEDDEEEEEEEEEEGERQKAQEQKEEVVPSISSTEEAAPAVLLSEEEEQRSEVKGCSWRGDDARSIVSGYSTLSTLGRSLASEGRGEDADDEHSELVSETDNESGFASRSLTQERPEKPSRSSQNPHASPEPTAPRSFLYAHCKSQTPSAASGTTFAPPPPSLTTSPEDGAARSSTPSTSSYSSSASQRLHSRHSFNSHRLIQCDTLARRRLKADKAKAPSVDLLELSSSSATEGERRSGANQIPDSSLSPSPKAKSSSKGVSGRNECMATSAASPRSYFLSTGQGSLADQVRARLMGSADDLRSIGLRKQLSPETRRKRRAWRRHTVVVSPTDSSDKKTPAPPPKPLASPSPVENQDVGESHPECSETEDPTAQRVLPTSRFRDFLYQ